MLTDIPFFKNPSNTHCWQASMKMILAHAFPDREYSWEELEIASNKKEGYGTWPMAGCLHFSENGFDVLLIEKDFDYYAIGQGLVKYLTEAFPKKEAEYMIATTDVPSEEFHARNFAQAMDDGFVQLKNRDVTACDFKEHLSKGHYIIQWVDQERLGDKDKMEGHYVVITGVNEDNIMFHDCACSANRQMSSEKFMNACLNGETTGGTYIFIKKEKEHDN